MSIHSIRRTWKEGTYMRLSSTDKLKTFVTTQEDLERYRSGKPIDPKKISQGDLARAAQVHRSFISQLVVGHRTSCSPLVAERICDRLGVHVTLLFDVERPAAAHPYRRRAVEAVAA